MKTCPYCAEEIKDAAIRCRWCHTWLVEEFPAGAETMPKRAAAEPAMVTVAEPEPAMAAVAEPEPEPAMAAVAEPEPAMAPVAEPEPATSSMEPVAASAAPVEEAAAPVVSEVAAVSAASEPSTSAAEPAPAEAAPAAEAKIEFTHTGSRYLLGYGGDYFGIWDRNAPQQAIERFPRNDEGWASAWQRYSSIETNWMDLRTGQKSG